MTRANVRAHALKVKNPAPSGGALVRDPLFQTLPHTSKLPPASNPPLMSSFIPEAESWAG
jgi:hypothetical protein